MGGDVLPEPRAGAGESGVKLAELRKEYERQKSIEDNAEIPDWALDGYRLVNSAGATIATLERTGSESTYMMLPMSRNLNPARLEVVADLLSRDGENDTAEIAAKLLFGKEVGEVAV